MNPLDVILAYLLLLSVQTITELILISLNIKHVKSHANSVPAIFTNTFDQPTYNKAVEYTLTKSKFSLVSLIYSALLLVIIILSGTLGNIDQALRMLSMPWYWHGILFIFATSLLFTIIGMPLELYSVFSIEERFGFNKTTIKQWILDQLKGLFISFLLLIPLLSAIFWFMDYAGKFWWVYGFIFVAVFQITISFLYPVLIAPLFNKFTPLVDGELKDQINSMASRADFKTSGIYCMDGSKRSAHANAYFTGFGKIKRIVLFDTLISILSTNQTVAVLAHEIGHEKKNHVKKMLFISLIFTALGFWLLSKLTEYPPIFFAFGFDEVSKHAALVLLAFGSSPITYYLSPLFAIFSRRFEYQADSYANKLVGNSSDLATALLALSKKSLSNLTPHPWYSFFHYSHPTLHERVSAMQQEESLAN